MKNLFLAVIMILVVSPLSACYGNDDLEEAQETPEVTDRKILIA